MSRVTKGHYGYIKYRKKSLMLRTGILAAGVIALFAMGYAATGNRNNLLTVVSIVTVLPTVNQLVVLLAIWPFSGRERPEYEEVAAIIQNGVLDAELVITSRENKTMQLDYAYIHSDGVYCYSQKGDAKKLESHLSKMLKDNGLHVKIRIFQQWKPFLACLKGLEPEDRDTCNERLLKIEGVLRALSI